MTAATAASRQGVGRRRGEIVSFGGPDTLIRSSLKNKNASRPAPPPSIVALLILLYFITYFFCVVRQTGVLVVAYGISRLRIYKHARFGFCVFRSGNEECSRHRSLLLSIFGLSSLILGGLFGWFIDLDTSWEKSTSFTFCIFRGKSHREKKKQG